MLSFIFMASSVVTHHRPQKPLVSRARPTASGIVCIPPCLLQSKAHTASNLPKAEFQASLRHPFSSKFLELSPVGCQSWGNKGVGERLASHQSSTAVGLLGCRTGSGVCGRCSLSSSSRAPQTAGYYGRACSGVSGPHRGQRRQVLSLSHLRRRWMSRKS